MNDGAISLVGQKAKTAADLAEIAQVLRHPGYEKFHYIYVDDDGNVKYHETVTSGLPGFSTILLPDDVNGQLTIKERLDRAAKRIRENMKQSGATRFYLLHNHPSGDPYPSAADFDVTKSILSYADLRRTCAGHIIIDHNKYAVIDSRIPWSLAPDQQTSASGLPFAIRDMKQNGKVSYDTAELRHNALGVQMADESISAYIADMYATEAETTAFFLDANFKIRGIQKIHDNFKDATEAVQTRYLRHCARVSAARVVILATSSESLYQKIKSRIEDGRDEGFVDVVLMKNKRAQPTEEKIVRNSPNSWFGLKISETTPKRVLENSARYGRHKKEPTLEEVLHLAPALEKAALEYGAKSENGKVTFTDGAQEKEFLQVAKALLSAGARKFSKAWTGSAADYDVPSLDYVGTGTGGRGVWLRLVLRREAQDGGRLRG